MRSSLAFRSCGSRCQIRPGRFPMEMLVRMQALRSRGEISCLGLCNWPDDVATSGRHLEMAQMKSMANFVASEAWICT